MRKKLKFEIFLERFFTNFHRIMLTNLLFAVPSSAIAVGMYFLNVLLFKGVSTPFSMIGIALVYPFYSGVVLVMRNISRGDSKVNVIRDYFSAIRENFWIFLLHGVIITIASIISYLCVTLYISLLSVSIVMYGILFIAILIAVLLFFATFYIPLMSLTFDIKLRYVYKNSLLMSFGEFKNNVFSLFAMVLITAICMTILMVSGSAVVLFIITGALWALLVPGALTFCYCFFVYDGMVSIMTEKERMSREIESSIDQARSKSADKPSMEQEVEDYSSIDVSKLKDTDDYIFFNGRMVKQSTLLRKIKEQEQNQKDDPNG